MSPHVSVSGRAMNCACMHVACWHVHTSHPSTMHLPGRLSQPCGAARRRQVDAAHQQHVACIHHVSQRVPASALWAMHPCSKQYTLTNATPRRLSRSADRLHVCKAGGAPPAAAEPNRPLPRLAVFVSGGGSNMKAVHAAILDGRINAQIAVVVSDVPTCAGVAYAQQHNIPTLTFPIPKKQDHPGLTTEQLVEALTGSHQIDYIILAGYLKLIPEELVRQFPKAMLNIHPGLLPSFGGKGMYGIRVHQAVIASGARFSGPTVHFVNEEFDRGPILAQRVVPVYPTDTPQQLAARVLKQEHQLYPEAVSALVDGRITWRDDGVPILWSAH